MSDLDSLAVSGLENEVQTLNSRLEKLSARILALESILRETPRPKDIIEGECSAVDYAEWFQKVHDALFNGGAS